MCAGAPSCAFLLFQEFSHWNRDPEFPGGPGCQPPLARGWLLPLESLLVSAPECLLSESAVVSDVKLRAALRIGFFLREPPLLNRK